MDFYNIIIKKNKDGTLQIRPDWKVGRSKDLMTRAGTFFAVWDEELGLWSKDIYDVQRLVDADLTRYAKLQQKKTEFIYDVAKLEINSTKLWDEFQRFIRNSGTNSHNLDENLAFANTELKKTDYATKRLGYSLRPGKCEAWNTIVGTLYNEEERAKIEWAIGAVVSGDSKFIQKFLVFYGPPASGKSTILNIINELFDGYTTVFDARELGSNNNAFATSAFKSNPLVAIQHDGDLSRIYDNTKLNSIVAHEVMSINEKYKAAVDSRSNAFLFMGTNLPVKISDAKSGILRRLIDVVPTQQIIEHDTYHLLMEQIKFELGPIAQHCLDVYTNMGKNYYSSYRPTEMMLQTDVFYNFVEAHFDIFKEEDGVTLKRAWELYKEYCASTGIDKVLPQYKLREELKNYFYIFEERARIDGQNIRSYYRGFKNLSHVPHAEVPIKTDGLYEIVLENQPSVFDAHYPGLPAQYHDEEHNRPEHKWINVTTTLSEIDTSKLHYVKVPDNHIVIDFDLTDENGNKNLAANLAKAAEFPPTYAEVSRSGNGLHLHYIYDGDVRLLSSVYDIGVEIKTLLGDSSLRRKLTLCNNMNITPIKGGLPTRKEKPVISDQSIKTERGLRDLIIRNLRKEIHPGTKPSVDFIHKILKEAYDSGMSYDVSDMRSDILTFAARSTNQASYCIKLVQSMAFVGKSNMVEIEPANGPVVFFDVEVYPNLFIVCWKAADSPNVVRMINPDSKEIEKLFSMKLVGFNNRRYDNHILYARYLGYSLNEIYHLSQKLITENNPSNYFGEAYNISYTDIYDFSSKKQGLKKFMIEYDIPHMELDIPWDEPVDEGLWDKIVEYCVNDVLGTERTFNERKQDFIAREILSEISGLSVNHTTQAHTAKIIFGDERKPQNGFVYTDLNKQFPGYKFSGKESTYRGEVTGEGGYVYAEPGIYENVALLDVASMHPTSIILLNLFGHYTERFADLKEARMAIKRKDDEAASRLLGGKLAKFVGGSDTDREALSYALKIVINIVYGLTSAKFENAFRDNRNKDNIVAKRGALFMIDLKHAVQEKGFSVVHIKTDSIKIPNATQEIIDFVTEFGKQYGYDFEHEKTFDKFILVNDAVYVARADDIWNAVGAQFQHPYVFKKLFTDEPVIFTDFCETKNVTQGTMYLDFSGTGELENMVHVGRTGSFVPVNEEGADLWRIKDGKKYAVTGTKGYSWITRDVAKAKKDADLLSIDYSYFEDLKQKAVETIMQFNPEGDFADTIS
jgi:energy-coupling factor transporter ATP-binding protein EcfA2